MKWLADLTLEDLKKKDFLDPIINRAIENWEGNNSRCAELLMSDDEMSVHINFRFSLENDEESSLP